MSRVTGWVAQMAKHMPCVVWPTRRVGEHPIFYLQTTENKKTKMSFFPGKDEPGVSVIVDRRHLRLLARRINQMLDETNG